MTARNKGFTLIELLIVMAILGVLAVVVLVAINPVQQLARTRDAGRKSGVAQLGRSLEAYYTAHGGSYIAEGSTWVGDLETAGEISTVPSAINPGVSPYTACTENAQSNWCYDTNGASLSAAIVYTVLESDSEGSKCSSGMPIFVWSTTQGRGGLVCNATADLNIADIDESSEWNPTQ
jgi:prepilin-type N-terminal cleavage/methylation domain-containing protein